MKKMISGLLVVLVLLSLVSCTGESAKKFTSNGMSIVLTDAFTECTLEGYTVCYDSKEAGVFVLKEPFSLRAGFSDLSIDDYAELVYDANASKSPSKISKEGGLTSMEYSFLNEEENQTYRYYTTVFKTSDAFWLIQFACKQEDYDAKRHTFIDWAKSIEFTA